MNFTLALLMMHYFPAADGQPHSRLSAKAASVLTGGPQESGEWVKGTWTLYNWQAIDGNFKLPEGQKDSSQWIWNEGKPADISVFEDRRVMLLGPPAYARTFPAQRTFAAMKPELRIEKVLAPDEVQGWLEKWRARVPLSDC